MISAERMQGATFDVATTGFIDFETRSPIDIRAGTYRYVSEADAIICTYAIGAGPVRTVSVNNFGDDCPLTWDGMPDDFRQFHAQVVKGLAVWATWNAAFDKAVWNYATAGFPVMEPHHVIDVMAQAVASGLAPDLYSAAEQSGSVRKAVTGNTLIKTFCVPGAQGTPQNSPDDWKMFRAYAAADIDAMRSVFLGTRQLPLAEWREYWAMERINERGIGIDLEMVRHAAALADEDSVRSRAEISGLTGGLVTSVDHVARITTWVVAKLPPEGVRILTAHDEIIGKDGVVERAATFQLTRNRVERLIAYVEKLIDATPAHAALRDVRRVLQIRLYGGSRTPQKFGRMLEQHVDGSLLGQYAFNGAAQTGRASSRGVQIHNLARDVLSDEPELIDALRLGMSYGSIASIGPDPVARKLSLLIRPALVPRGEDVAFVWSDWSQIEARVLPWLAGNHDGALARLKVFIDVDADPTLPDLYTRTAAVLSGVPIRDVTRPIRQRGKVAELALGYGGGRGALQSMGAGYGLHIGDAEADEVVRKWRAANRWCVDFWGVHTDFDTTGLWGAAHRAMKQPGVPHQAGRIHYVYDAGYLGGTLLAVLPSGRMLAYRDIRYERVADEDDNGRVIGHTRRLRFSRGHGRVVLWHGMLCENVVQAVAADVLRGTLVRLERAGYRVCLHSHDEVLVEARLPEVEVTSAALCAVMRRGFDWSKGLPLMSEETSAWYYTKSEKDHGL